jgi:hypothetical protein
VLLLLPALPLELLFSMLLVLLLLLVLMGSGMPTAVMRVCSRYSLLRVATWPSLSGMEPVMGL